MEFSSVNALCLHLISLAFQRCRLSEQICRLSVILNRSSSSQHPSVQISISDTGIGSCLKEFQDLNFSWGGITEKWDGMLSVNTTSISDPEIYNYQFSLKENRSSRRINRLPSYQKNGAKFSGTEVFLSFAQSLDILLADVRSFLQKMLILRIPNIALQLVAEDSDVPGSRYEKVFLANKPMQSPILASNLQHLKSGFEEYVLTHGNSLNSKCNSCFPCWEHLKVGSGRACCSETELVMEAVIVISNVSKDNSTCLRESGDKTEVMYFKDFSPCTIPQSSMKALKSVGWRRYGLNLTGTAQQDGRALLEWENLPTDTQIDIVLHSYHQQTMIRAPRKESQTGRNLVKRAVKLSLDDLKNKHAGALLSARATKICSYAPDLGKTIAGLILSSNDLEFQGECLSLLGLQSQRVGAEIVENRIVQRIVSVIEMNDKKDQKTQEAAPFLFDDDRLREEEFQENDEGDYNMTALGD
ncbi:type 2 DNA topoisomerase 6 subunit B-like [Neltuma alba]|uniref:type 2 DNA topoisomerase 6 subunit B-like n=1 Tax=Neltuma alba TaxID=207710 RepID=UPI0010A34DF3|nr:type 2 DNA topoisomerase 6 subunit B-like [Prosopis alba]